MFRFALGRLKYVLFVFLCGITFLANFSSPPSGASGAPGDSTCGQVGCHSNPSQTINGTITVEGLPQTVDPNTAYSLSVILTADSGDPVFGGFQMTVLDDQNDFAGSFSNAGENTTVVDSPIRGYVEHDGALSFDAGSVVTYTVDWTSPAEVVEAPFTFYVAANFANGNGTNSGDHIETASFQVDVPLIVDNDNDGFDADEDCDDNDAAINPDATEIPNNAIDENCDGIVEVIDIDSDGFNSDDDCNDNDAAINPDATEIPNNAIDENCDGIVEVIDMDSDGFNSDEDCNDNDAAINPDATEIPNNAIDENCDGIVEVIDMDSDGFNSDEDCNDDDAAINPDATEIPNNAIDENCDGIVEVIDMDNDGFNSDEDCNDNDAAINPDATEIPDNGIDDNCDGVIDPAIDTSAITITLLMANGQGLANVNIDFSDPGIGAVMTGADGSVRIPLPADTSSVILTFSKDDAPSNGVTGLDIVILRRHILNFARIEDPLVFMAGDVNGNGNISAADIVQLRNVILGFWDSFPNKKVWEFMPAQVRISRTEAGQQISISAIKTGDVNNSASPN